MSRLCLLSCPAWHNTKQLVQSYFLLEEGDRQHDSLGSGVCTNKVQSSSFGVLVCPACSIILAEQGTRQGPNLSGLQAPCSLGRK